MRAIDVNLKADLDAGFKSILTRIILKDGTVLGYTDHDFPLTVDGTEHIPAPGLKTIRMTVTASAEVSTQELGSAWVDVPDEDLYAGKFDDAILETSWCSWKNPQYGKVVIYKGELGSISWTEDGYTAEIANSMKGLAKLVGQTYTASCRHTLYSNTIEPGLVGYCGVDKASFSSSATIDTVVTTKWKFTMTGISQPDGYFSNGTITFTSGTSTGLTYQIKAHVGSTITLALPTAFVITPGTTCTLAAGCDKTLETCKNRFNNVVNFGGYPDMQTDVTFRS